jgi:predicted HTH domain antitoxin
MQVTLDIPDNLAEQLIAAGKDPSREALEALAVEGYRTQRLTESEVRQMLGYETRMQVHALLKEHDVYLHYSLEDLETDAETSRYARSLRAQEAKQPAE